MKTRSAHIFVWMAAVVVLAGLSTEAAAQNSVVAIDRMAPAKVQLGDVFEYQIKITNMMDVALTDVTVVETVADGFKYESAVPAPDSAENGQLRWNLGSLAPRAGKVIQVKGAAEKEGVIKNCNTLKVSYELEKCAMTQVVRPALTLAKTGVAEVLRCDPIPMELTVTNTGTGVAEHVMILDALPEGLMTQDGKGEIKAEIGTLEPGQSRQIKAVLMAGHAGKFENKAVATADRNLKAEASHTVTVREPKLVLAKTGPQKRFLGRNAAYTIKVSNTGDGDAKETVIVDTLPAGMSFLSASDGGKLENGKILWKLGTLAPNASRDLTVDMRADTIGSMKNTVVANAYCAQAAAECVTDVEGISAILLEVIDLEDPIEVGANLTYVIVVTNQGTAVGTNIKLVCTLPAEQDYVLSTGPTKAAVDGKKITFAPLASLAPKAEATFKVIVKGVKPGDVRFRTDLNSDQMTTPVMETEATKIYE